MSTTERSCASWRPAVGRPRRSASITTTPRFHQHRLAAGTGTKRFSTRLTGTPCHKGGCHDTGDGNEHHDRNEPGLEGAVVPNADHQDGHGHEAAGSRPAA